MPIEQIKVGDKVLSYDEKTKQFEYNTVAQTFTAVKENIVKIKIRGEKLLITTTEHPYARIFFQARGNTSSEDAVAQCTVLANRQMSIFGTLINSVTNTLPKVE